MSELWHSFVAFNVNGYNYLTYMLSQNWSIALLLVSAVTTTILYIKDAIVLTTRDEQNIL